ncbi:MAG TPA: YciI family protein [Thermoanaerobaculia bacterium]
MDEAQDEPSAAEKAALASLRTEIVPDRKLERDVVETLAARGLIRPSTGARNPWLRRFGVLAGSASLLAIGVAIGMRESASRASESGLPRYVLFLEGAESLTPEEETRRVQEYKNWARRVAGEGHLISGEKLSAEVLRLGDTPDSAPSGGESVRGYFVIAARDQRQALEIARGCPHLRHGGWIVVRPIAPV